MIFMTTKPAPETPEEIARTIALNWVMNLDPAPANNNTSQLQFLIAAALRTATLAERERAARIADELARLNTGPKHGYAQVAAEMAAAIGEAIRAEPSNPGGKT